jgi:hypothetical protein
MEVQVTGFEVDYFGTTSSHLYFQTDVNRYPGDMIQHNGTLDRLNSSFGSVLSGQSIGVSNAEVASFAISKGFSRGLSVHAIYNFGKALDYTSSNDNGVGGAENVIDATDPRRNYGRCRGTDPYGEAVHPGRALRGCAQPHRCST